MIKDTKELYDICKYKALRQYTSVDAKKTKLGELDQIRNQAIEKNIISKPASKNLPDNTIPTYLNDYKIAWFTIQNAEINSDAFVDGVTIQEAGLTAYSSHCFAQEDANQLKQGHWILAWKITNKNEPYKKYSENYFYWMYVHHLVTDGYKDSDVCEDFPLVAFQWEERITPEPPFELNAVIYEAFKQTLADSRFLHFSEVDDSDSIWTIEKGNRDIEIFIDVWRENLKKISS